MKKRSIVRTTLTTLALVLVLVGSVTVVAIGTQLAYATNESSYKFGFQQGKTQYSQCTYRGDEDEPCDSGYSSCTGTWNNAITIVTNVTACIDGYIHAWNHVCNPAQTKTWPNNEVPCPTDTKRELQ